jgi:5-methyltetrahydropteroyltriglutamate--homocysteine methyltransferase
VVNIRGEDVLLPTTIVGSYPRAQFLEGKVFPLDGVNAPEFPSFRTRTLYRNAVALAIKDMTDAGLDVVTDGCQHYESDSDYEQGEIFHFYLDRLEGFVPYGDNISAGHFNNIPVYKPTGAARSSSPSSKPSPSRLVSRSRSRPRSDPRPCPR